VTWTPGPYSLPPLVAAGIATALAVEGYRQRDRPVAQPFVVLMATIAAWSLAYAVQLGFRTLEAQLFWSAVSTTLGSTVPVIWMVLTLVYAGHRSWLTRRRLAALAAEPVALWALLWSNSAHGLVWTDATLEPAASTVVLDLSYGPAYLVHLGVAYLFVLVGVAVLLGVFVRSTTVYRRQAGLLVVGAVVPLAANVAFTAGLSPVPEIDLTTSVFTLTGVVFALALFRFDFLELTPVAREQLVEEFGGGLVVVDDAGRVVEHDDVARAVVDGLERVGRDLTDLLAVEAITEVDGRVMGATVDGRERTYETGVSPLTDHRGEVAGWMVALQDVTARREYEQRLEVANRLLRHNLRNDMTKVIGLANLIADQTSGEPATVAENIVTVAEDVAEMSRKARQIETTLDASRTDSQAVRLRPLLETVVEEGREECPSAAISLSVADDPTVTAPGRDLLASAFANVVGNAVAHSDRDEPEVTVSAERVGETVAVEVGDDGPGIPEIERAVLESGEESALDHASGLGLWLAHWVATACGGSVAFEENEPRGSVVVFRLPTPADGEGMAGTAVT